VIIMTSIKVFLVDLRGSSTIYMASFLFILGLLVLLIARVDKYWRDKHQKNKVAEIVEQP
ncbi:MAG: hypothetical protein KAR17_05540, partial [Cyclobacteriaceae bacterium]|nr:hypothetical protein [Cyclobacteriaceae bacterium]